MTTFKISENQAKPIKPTKIKYLSTKTGLKLHLSCTREESSFICTTLFVVCSTNSVLIRPLMVEITPLTHLTINSWKFVGKFIFINSNHSIPIYIHYISTISAPITENILFLSISLKQIVHSSTNVLPKAASS